MLDALLYSVSHDLRSPLLTMTLSADLVQGTLPSPGQGDYSTETMAIALDSFRNGAIDLERMIEALTNLSRVRRQALEPARAPLSLVLGGYQLAGDTAAVSSTVIAVDALELREFIDGIVRDDEAAIDVQRLPGQIELATNVNVEDLVDAPPLAVLVGSLNRFAGTAVETLGVRQLLLERRGCSVRVAGGRLSMDVPVVDTK